jgi:hypothetical protein
MILGLCFAVEESMSMQLGFALGDIHLSAPLGEACKSMAVDR